MGGRIWKPDDGYSRGIVREIRHRCVVVRGREDVDCERSGAIAARVVVGSVDKWHGVARREDRVAGGGGDGGVRGDGGGGGRSERRGADEPDGSGGYDDDGDVYGSVCVVSIYRVYI